MPEAFFPLVALAVDSPRRSALVCLGCLFLELERQPRHQVKESMCPNVAAAAPAAAMPLERSQAHAGLSSYTLRTWWMLNEMHPMPEACNTVRVLHSSHQAPACCSSVMYKLVNALQGLSHGVCIRVWCRACYRMTWKADDIWQHMCTAAVCCSVKLAATWFDAKLPASTGTDVVLAAL